MALTVIKSTGVDLSGNTVTIGTLYQSNLPQVFNDISTQFDGAKTVFQLRINQDSINTIVDSKDVDVSLNGQILLPYVDEWGLPWIAEYDSYGGYRVSGGNLIIYNAPSPGDKCIVIYRNKSQTTQVRKYPYSATVIALGD